MPTAAGPRFVLEAGFLVLLAVVVGLADLDPLLIVLVLLVGWILVSLIEYLAWRQSQTTLMRGLRKPASVLPDCRRKPMRCTPGCGWRSIAGSGTEPF